MSIKFIQLQPCTLEAFLNDSDTSFDVAGFLYNDGVTPVAVADIGDICYATLEPRTEREELISFTIDSVTSAGVATITVVRGLSQKSPYGTGGATFDHQAGSNLVISNNPALFNKLAIKDNDEVITGTWIFNIAPTALSVTRATTAILGNMKLSSAALTNLGVATITIASPAVITKTAHLLIEGDSVQLTTTGALPTGLTAGVDYFVIATGLTANDLQVSLTIGGAAVVTTGSQSGIHTLYRTTPVAVGNDDPRVPNDSESEFISATTGMISMYGGSATPTGFLLCDGSAVSRTTYAALFAIISTNYGVGDGSTTFNVPDLRSSFPVGLGQKTKAFTFVDGDVTVGTDQIVIDTNDFLHAGQAVVLSTDGVLPAGLSSTTYYIIEVSAGVIKLATSRANADDGTAVDITAAAGGGTHTLTLTLTDRSMGDEGGEEDHTLQTEELASHGHNSTNDSGTAIDATAGGSGNHIDSSNQLAGGDTPHNTMPPYVTVNYIIKT